jgi:hypothetical protein
LASSFEAAAVREKKTRKKQMLGFGASKAMICWIEGWRCAISIGQVTIRRKKVGVGEDAACGRFDTTLRV